MRHASPTHELDRLINDAQAAQAELRSLIDGMVPDDHGVVTATLEDASDRGAELRDALIGFEERGLAIASTIDDLHPQTSGSFDQFAMLTRRIRSRLDRASVGDYDGSLAAVTEETASVAVEIAPAEEDGGPSYYGV